ncbi:anti-sigma regulatory factor [Granulicella sibirica]|uniref:Anti-sigma B factor RsbT n=1 Tax=Granulicella sibirica TaxID=2479048 RepID=A0A4Q0T4Q2_9BACT|nr:anti-sigma regulatory factor [Granulicella sibirica]RXH57932.1 Anti-sigma B factor RsbT [Granulicella sibirica]
MLPLSPEFEGSTAAKILPIRTADDIVLLRAAVRTAALEAGLGLVELTKLVTASVEIGRNTLTYGREGEVAIDTIYEKPSGVRLTFSDRGPGIEDVHLAMKDGFTTSGAMGLGLGGTSRLVDEFHIVSAPDEGTTVTIAKWKR